MSKDDDAFAASVYLAIMGVVVFLTTVLYGSWLRTLDARVEKLEHPPNQTENPR